jgi:sigma-B regulation protein RsbU (phosphoserine phosphatase)
MMVTKGLLTAAAQDSSDLAGILKGINMHLHRACRKKVFVTMAALAVEPGGRGVEYARAGHNPIVWRRARRGETLLVKPGGIGLGLCGSEQFGRSLRLERMELEPGDAVVLYSDGVTEAVNAKLDQFGEERLIRAVEQADGRSAEETRASILRELAAFRGNTPAWDDITLVALRVGA